MKIHRYTRVVIFLIAIAALSAVILIGITDDGGIAMVGEDDLNSSHVQLPDQVNVLVVGIDQRYKAEKKHCDAIHLLHFDVLNETIELVNVPRGTRINFAMPEDWGPEPALFELARERLNAEAKATMFEEWRIANPELKIEDVNVTFEDLIPKAVEGEDVEPPPAPEVLIVRKAWEIEQYVSNICKYVDFETFVATINELTGLEADYTVRVGFSETQALLRVLDFNPTTTLQFLRHRKSYGLGDNQRSYNQSVFIGDALLTRTDEVSRVPKPARRALYSLVQTDMPFATAESLLSWLGGSKIPGNADRITHRTEPKWTPKAQEIHYDPELAEKQVGELLEKLGSLQPGFEVSDIQPTVRGYIDEGLVAGYRHIDQGEFEEAALAIQPIKDTHIWFQLEDDDERQKVVSRLALMDAWIRVHADVEAHLITDFADGLAELLALEEGGEDEAQEIWDLTSKINALYEIDDIDADVLQ